MRPAPRMKVLTLWQPWATLIAIGAKRVETRSWPAPIYVQGQRIAIHAAKTQDHLDLCFEEPFRDALAGAGYYPGSKPLPLSAIVATAKLSRCREINDGMDLWLEQHNPTEHAFGDYTPGRIAWVLDDIEKLPEPLEVSGAQGLWEVDEAFVTGRSLF